MNKSSLEKHREWQGKIEVALRCPLENREDLSLAYTPGVAEPCLAIRDDPALSFLLTRRGNTVAVITDGTAVLGLGDIGPEAGMPVMEGKCALFKRFGGVDAIPLCVRTKDPDEFVRTVALLAGSFGGINLEDIAAPRCFEIERCLSQLCDIPVFHDDQHGTAIVAGAALLGALKVVGKEIGRIRCVINGAGSAGIAIGQHLLRLGVRDLVLCDRDGVLAPGLPSLTDAQAQMLPRLNPRCIKGTLTDAMTGADVLIGVSRGGVVSGEMVRSMNNDAVVFALANPVPEIAREDALAAGARVVGCGRSDTPNQINNLLAFPGVFRGALDCRARTVNDEMKCAATYAIAACAEKHGLSEDYVIPSPFDENVCPAVAAAVIDAARRTGAARL